MAGPRSSDKYSSQLKRPNVEELSIPELVGEKEHWFVYLGCCRSGMLNYVKDGKEWSEWLEAFNATTFIGWQGRAMNIHLPAFSREFFNYGWIRANETALEQMNRAFLYSDMDGEILAWYSKYRMCYAYPTLAGDPDIKISEGPLGIN